MQLMTSQVISNDVTAHALLYCPSVLLVAMGTGEAISPQRKAGRAQDPFGNRSLGLFGVFRGLPGSSEVFGGKGQICGRRGLKRLRDRSDQQYRHTGHMNSMKLVIPLHFIS